METGRTKVEGGIPCKISQFLEVIGVVNCPRI